MALPSLRWFKPNLLQQADVLKVAHEIWSLHDGAPVVICLDPEPGYNIGQDLAWQMRLRVRYLHRDLTCYLSTLDLAGSLDDLRTSLTDSWRAAFWNDQSGKQIHG